MFINTYFIEKPNLVNIDFHCQIVSVDSTGKVMLVKWSNSINRFLDKDCLMVFNSYDKFVPFKFFNKGSDGESNGLSKIIYAAPFCRFNSLCLIWNSFPIVTNKLSSVYFWYFYKQNYFRRYAHIII